MKNYDDPYLNFLGSYFPGKVMLLDLLWNVGERLVIAVKRAIIALKERNKARKEC